MKLFVLDKFISDIPNDVTHILNTSGVNLDDKRVIDYSLEYRNIVEDAKKSYIGFLKEFGEKSGLLHQLINDKGSLWHFSELQHKDSFFDPFFRDLTIVLLVKKIEKELKINEVEIASDSDLINSFFKKKYNRNRLFFLRIIVRRIRIFAVLLISKIIIKQRKVDKNIRHIFVSFFPRNWNTHNDKFTDRFFREVPITIPGCAFAINITKPFINNSLYNLPETAIIVPKYVGFFYLTACLFNFRHALWYLKNKKKLIKLSKYYGINLWPVYRKYILETVLFNDFYYGILIYCYEKIIKIYKPDTIISAGEFGPPAKAVAVTARGNPTRSIWYQHTLYRKDLLFYINHKDEIDPDNEITMTEGVKPSEYILMPVPDKFLTWSVESTSSFSRTSHFPVSKCFEVGAVKYYFFNQCKSRKLDISPKSVFFAPTISESETMQFCYFINELIQRKVMNPSDVVLKLHPIAKAFFNVDSVIRDYPHIKNIRIIIGVSGIEDFIGQISCIVVGGTTLGPEAAYFQIPVVQYLPKYRLNLSPLNEEQATCFQDIETLVKILDGQEKIIPIDYRKYFTIPSRNYHRFKEALEY